MIQEAAIKCRYCGEFVDGRSRAAAALPAYGWGYEYRSKTTIAGWPLLHVAQGVDPATGAPRVARGVIAVGQIAVGVLAIGGVAFGGIALGGASLGLAALGGIAVGIGAAVGGVSASGYLAMGGLALSLHYAIGGLAVAPHAVGGATPEVMEFFERLGQRI
jgi:hypothetical protein